MTEQLRTPISQISKDANNMVLPTADSKNNQQDTPNTPNPIFIEVQQNCRISAEQLKRYSDPDELPTDTRTAPDLDVGFGQQRALKALHTALDIKASGYHVFAVVVMLDLQADAARAAYGDQ